MRTRAALAGLLVWTGIAGEAVSAGFTVRVHDPRTGVSLGEARTSSILVAFDPGLGEPKRRELHAALRTSEFRELGAPGLYEVLLPEGLHPDAALSYYASLPSVRGVYPNRVYRVSRTPNDPLIPLQYALSQMNAFGAWEFEIGASSPVTVAVMDTGVRKTHQDVAPKYDAVRSKVFCPAVTFGSDCFGGSCSPLDDSDAFGHGTLVAAVAAAAGDDGLGVAGLAWHPDARIASLKVFTDQGCSDDATITAALNYAAGLSAATGRRTVLNMSLGSCDAANPSNCGPCNGALETAAANAIAGGTVLVAAAGNQSGGNPNRFVECPAKIAGVLAVGATDSNQNIAGFSAQGPEMTAQGVVAPGVNVETASNASDASYTGGATGTSFAAPQAAGLAALILSAKPALSAPQVVGHIRGSTDLIGPSALGPASSRPAGAAQGSGRVNAYSAMRLAVKGTLADFEGRSEAIAFPNPFRPSVSGNVGITVPIGLAGAKTSIKVYTVDGRLVRTLQGLAWDGKNEHGIPVATGTYLFLVSTANGAATGKLALIR